MLCKKYKWLERLNTRSVFSKNIFFFVRQNEFRSRVVKNWLKFIFNALEAWIIEILPISRTRLIWLWQETEIETET